MTLNEVFIEVLRFKYETLFAADVAQLTEGNSKGREAEVRGVNRAAEIAEKIHFDHQIEFVMEEDSPEAASSYLQELLERLTALKARRPLYEAEGIEKVISRVKAYAERRRAGSRAQAESREPCLVFALGKTEPEFT